MTDMKKYIFFLFAVLAFALTACDNETEPGGTAVEKMAGDWMVSATDANGTQSGYFMVYTYNTAANVTTEMFIEAGGEAPFVYKAKMAVEYDARTFTMADFSDNMLASEEDAPAKIKVTNGKVEEGAATTPSGMPADKISFTLELKDGTVYTIEGFRRTGFQEDNLI